MSKKPYRVDLHVHTVLSPCADLLMTPGNIIKRALEKGIDILAITDHNSAENLKPALHLARNTELKIIPGIEVETSEEVHLLCLFEDVDSALQLQEFIYKLLPDMENREDVFGQQLQTDENDQYIKKVKQLLSTAVNISLQNLVKKVNALGGTVIPSHINRVNGIVKQLGFIPDDLNISILEANSKNEIVKLEDLFPGYSIIKNSDSHYLDQIKPSMQLWLEKPSLPDIVKTLIDAPRGKPAWIPCS